jgi:hypothetical protein
MLQLDIGDGQSWDVDIPDDNGRCAAQLNSVIGPKSAGSLLSCWAHRSQAILAGCASVFEYAGLCDDYAAWRSMHGLFIHISRLDPLKAEGYSLYLIDKLISGKLIDDLLV